MTDATTDPRAEIRRRIVRRLNTDEWMNRHFGISCHAGDVADAVLELFEQDPDRDERLRAEGRRQADNAITWGTSCLGCADRLDGLIAERYAGADQAAREIEAELQAYYGRTGDSGVREAVAVVRAYIARGLQRHAGPPTEAFAEPSDGEPT